MADVHLGTDTRLGRRVAIKLLKPSLATDPAFRSRFRREAQDAAKMAHPTIVRIFDAGEETIRDSNGNEIQLPFIVMEYVDGRVLKDLIAAGPIEPNEAIRITEEVLTALEYSHRAGVVHRDIKPGNIMITTGGQVKVMDFGIARAVSESSANIAQTSTIMGTAQYFSPEQARGETVDARTDLYSTGIVLFEMLTGHPPFTGENPVAVAYQHVNQQVPPPSSINPRVSPAIDAVVLRAVAKDRFERFQSATEFREAAVAASSGIVPRRKSPDDNDFNAALFGVNPSVTAGAEATMRQLTADNSERLVRTQSRPPVAWIWGGIAVIAVIIVAVMIWTLTITHTTFDSGLSVTVPDVKNQSWDAGSALLKNKKLVPERIDETSKTVTSGTILRTDPKAGERVRPQQSIKVYVSSGPEKVSIPQVVGMTQADAQKALEAKGLKVGTVTEQHSPSIVKGNVISLSPDANTKASAGSSVDLVVSDGIVTVPSVIGQTIANATTLLSGPSVKLDVVTQSDSGCSGGLVTTQSIVGDQPQGSTITIIYCGSP
jgi:eukaryotic-like serine/threonine-protein kinase